MTANTRMGSAGGQGGGDHGAGLGLDEGQVVGAAERLGVDLVDVLGARRASREQKAVLASLSPEQVTATELAGEPILAKLTEAPGNGAKIGGLKVTTKSAWFAARPSGTEDVYKIYAESFRGPDHLREVQAAAREVVSAALGG